MIEKDKVLSIFLVVSLSLSIFLGINITNKDTSSKEEITATGLSEDEISDANKLIQRHEDIIKSSSFIYNTTTVRNFQNGTLLQQKDESIKMENSSNFLLKASSRGENNKLRYFSSNRVEYYADGEKVIGKLYKNNKTRYHVPTSARGEPIKPRQWLSQDPANSDQLYMILSLAKNETVREISHSGEEKRYKISIIEFVETPNIYNEEHTNINSMKSEIIVDKWGMVQRYSIEFESSLDGKTIYTKVEKEYKNIDKTTVSAPNWFKNKTI
ncbi:DUF7537 family lipoprotein [Haladaptatus cibarius]|uniref:DUF7537 family lipoprotein n=1 Tax=Haladaptatus cibarius TaxID=453847 RepID=UPI000679C4E6|nr:hypothetical protein [Haladaptatus cibarius]